MAKIVPGRVMHQYGGELVVFHKLYDYASAGSLSHRPAWTRFNAMAKKNPGAVGIWHETFVVERAESMYVGTPAMGLPAGDEDHAR
ncbi:monooxygenase family protein [Pseudonocardia xinjiangensis]|uniref:monooxygenase family protein n=1 Tax=Pseudonocardia xinjiangensis TaxID=75289 RepID=UPI001FE7B8AA|nr:DUF4188 domain-containing protein [Pseudonocardia xinjiangensis]